MTSQLDYKLLVVLRGVHDRTLPTFQGCLAPSPVSLSTLLSHFTSTQHLWQSSIIIRQRFFFIVPSDL